MRYEAERRYNMTEMELERLRIRGKRILEANAVNHVFKNMNISVKEQIEGQIDIAVDVVLAGLTRQKEHIHQFQYPDGWWQMFKREHMPRWFIKRYPVRMKIVKDVVKIDHMAIFPEYDMWHRDRVVMFVDKVV